MEKGKKKLIIRILNTAVVLAVAIAICTFVAKKTTEQVEASTNILQKVSTKYTGGNFKILEVVPEHAANENEEIGYFVKDKNSDKDFREVSRAKSIGSLFTPDPDEGISNLLMMRNYGLIKDYGVDYGNQSGFVSDNPVYSDSATFASNPTSGFELADKQYVAGIFEMDPGNAGNYQMDTNKYFIDSSGTINVMKGVSENSVSKNSYNFGGGALTRTLSVIANTDGVTEEIPAKETPEVNNQDEVTVTVEDDEEPASNEGNGEKEKNLEEKEPQSPQNSPATENQPGGNLLQGMEIDTNPAEGSYGNRNYQWLGATATESNYEPVAEGDRFNKGLPEGIEWVGNGTGNVRFTETPAGKYYGYAIRDLYYNTDSNNYFHNGSWFKELVFGDANKSINVSIKTATPTEIAANGINTKEYDLIYISGRNEVYIQKGEDFTDSQVMDLYNAVVSNEHQAVIMDYALIDTDTVGDKAALGTLSNMEKLVLLLWQKDQTAVLTDTLSGNGAGGAANNGFDISTAGNGDISILSFGSVSNTVWHYLMTTAPLGGYGNFVAGSVYVYEHRLQYFQSPKAQVDAYDFFGNGDFNSRYVDTIVAAGLSQVEYAVRINNTNNPTEKMSEQVTPAVVVQYILSYDGTASELVKNDLRILEIEPCRDFSFNIGWGTQSYLEIKNGSNRYKNQCLTNREEFIKRYLGEPFIKEDGSVEEANVDRVRFTSMTIDEFICISDNLRENFDIIYIGSNCSPNPAYDTYYNGSTGNYSMTNNIHGSGQITDFEDNAMDGMVYFNIGDTASITEYHPWSSQWIHRLWGFLDNNTEYYTDGRVRYAARDLTIYKKTELLDYLDTGYPIIVAEDMLKTDTDGNRIINPTQYDTGSAHGVDHGRIDNSSVMYEFFQVATGQSTDLSSIGNYSSIGYENFIAEADFTDASISPAEKAVRKEKVIQAVNAAKMSMDVTSRPTEYEYTVDSDGAIKADSQAVLSPEADGKYYLEFEFTLQNFAVNSTESDIYTPKLYVDVNADGKFSESEELEGAVVTNALTGVEVPHAASVRGNVYELSTNVLYRLKRDVPDGYQGVLPWCLKVAKSTNPNVSASETGYSAIKGESAAVIKILQITRTGDSSMDPNRNDGSNLNLQQSIATGSNYYGKYSKRLADLKMFDLNVTTINQEDYVTSNYIAKVQVDENTTIDVNKGKYYTCLNEFDMLVLGFGDNFDDTHGSGIEQINATNAIRDYIDSGKPVLLTHDFMEHYPNYKSVSILRDVLGMDRYGVTVMQEVRSGKQYAKADPNDAAAIAAIEGSGRRVAYQPGSNKRLLAPETQGFTMFVNMKYKHKGHPYLVSPDTNGWAYSNNQEYVMFVDKVNDGQITNYPYKLPDAFAVNNTHGQYFQPNMEADQDEDGTADITIWYTLAYGHNDKENPDSEAVTSKLSDGAYNISPKDGVNNFYIFNSGNVTYTGSGHDSLILPDNRTEAQLFINTLVAAYRAGIKRPTVSIYDGNDLNSSPISNIVVPYDENIGLNASDTNKAESSIIKDKTDTTKYQYPFVGISDANATRAWFRVSDPNMVKGTKEIQLKFWMGVPSGTENAQSITLDNGEVITVQEIKMPFYSADFTQTYAYDTSATSGVMYGLKLPMDLLKSSNNFKLYVEAQTTIESVSITGKRNKSISGKSYASLGVTKMDLLKLD